MDGSRRAGGTVGNRLSEVCIDCAQRTRSANPEQPAGAAAPAVATAGNREQDREQLPVRSLPLTQVKPQATGSAFGDRTPSALTASTSTPAGAGFRLIEPDSVALGRPSATQQPSTSARPATRAIQQVAAIGKAEEALPLPKPVPTASVTQSRQAFPLSQKVHQPAVLGDLAAAMAHMQTAVAYRAAADTSSAELLASAAGAVSGTEQTGSGDTFDEPIVDLTTTTRGPRINVPPTPVASRPVRRLTDLPWDGGQVIPVAMTETSDTFEMEIPEELPGADARPLELPPYDASQPPARRREQMRAIYRDLPAIVPSLPQMLHVDANPVTLEDLQQLANEHSPVLRQAAAAAERARGQVLQAGLYPNPKAGYQADTVGTADTDGYQGGFLEQEFVTAGKLSLAQSAARMQYRAAREQYRQAGIRLAADVRRGAFRVLVTQMKVQLATAVARLSEEAYEAQIALVAGGEAASYEPLQLRVFAAKARNEVVRARNAHLAAWLELAAVIGLPDLPPAVVAGDPEQVLPPADEAAAWNMIASHHTALAIAQADIARSSYNLQLQSAIPIPNVTVGGVVQHDDTSPANDYSYNLNVGLPIPVFNRNQGNVVSARSELHQSRHSLEATRNRLTGELAAVLNRYETSRQIADTYRNEILADQVRAYRGLYDRFRVAGDDIDFSQIVVAQQQLTDTMRSYVEVLDDQWQAAAALSELMQVERVEQMFALFTREGAPGAAVHTELGGAVLPVEPPAQAAPPAPSLPPAPEQAPANDEPLLPPELPLPRQ